MLENDLPKLVLMTALARRSIFLHNEYTYVGNTEEIFDLDRFTGSHFTVKMAFLRVLSQLSLSTLFMLMRNMILRKFYISV